MDTRTGEVFAVRTGTDGTPFDEVASLNARDLGFADDQAAIQRRLDEARASARLAPIEPKVAQAQVLGTRELRRRSRRRAAKQARKANR